MLNFVDDCSANYAYVLGLKTGYQPAASRTMLHCSGGVIRAAGSFNKEGRMTPIKSITEKLSAWRRYREAVRELSQLTDRELEDIGVRRGDIPFIAAGSARKDA